MFIIPLKNWSSSQQKYKLLALMLPFFQSARVRRIKMYHREAKFPSPISLQKKGIIIIFPQTGSKHAVTHTAEPMHQLDQTR